MILNYFTTHQLFARNFPGNKHTPGETILKAIFSYISIILSVIFIVSCAKESGTVKDIDGNSYQTIRIGNQVWMQENLRVTHYRNGDLIPNVSDTAQWCHLPAGSYCNYRNSEPNEAIYGRLYNWYAVADIRNIAPKGWHIPSLKELEILITVLGGDTSAAGKMKEKGLSHWIFPNAGATNESGFSSLPGGYRSYLDGTFHTLRANGYWWTTTQSYEIYSWSNRIYWYFANANHVPDFKYHGFSIRCIKD